PRRTSTPAPGGSWSSCGRFEAPGDTFRWRPGPVRVPSGSGASASNPRRPAMSEYQYYEFRAVDRPLSPKAVQELRDLSSRAEITSRRFVNVYNYGDFRGHPEEVLARYFEAFLSLARWGTSRPGLPLPKGLVGGRGLGPD